MAGIETQTFSLTLAGHSLNLPADRIGEGPPALLLPALSSISTREEMRSLAMRLSTRHRCLVPDWPGFGAQPRARVPLAPDTLHAFLDALLAQAPGPYALGVAAGHAARSDDNCRAANSDTNGDVRGDRWRRPQGATLTRHKATDKDTARHRHGGSRRDAAWTRRRGHWRSMWR